jgi:hypothetical protein
MADRLVSVDSSTYQFPAAVRARSAANLVDPTQVEGIALDKHLKRANINVKDYGAVGDGAADETAAFNAAIAAANALGGSDREGVTGVTIVVPDGRYRLPTNLNPITVSYVTITGASVAGTVLLISATGALFTFGDATRTRLAFLFGLTTLRLEYPADPAAGAVVVKVDYGSETIIDNIETVRIRTLVLAGTSATNYAGSVTVRNVRGSSANVAGAFVDLKYGAGLNIVGCAMFVRGVVAPVHPASMTTVQNVNVVNAVGSHWDTVMIADSIFERYDYGIAGVSLSGTIVQNIFIDNCVFDYFKTSCLYLEAQAGGTISTVRVSNTWFAAWEGHAIFIGGAGYNDFHDIKAVVAIAGLSSLRYDVTNAHNNRFELTVASSNRLGTATAALYFSTGATGFTVANCRGNNDNGTGTWRSPYGMLVGDSTDDYIVTGNQMGGSTQGYLLGVSSSGSKLRRINGNIGTGYAGYSALTLPASTVAYTNTTGTTMDIHIHGGTITAIVKNGTTIAGMTSGHLVLEPGETFAITYSATPSVTRFVQG